ncbi:hypothetical protein ABPG77_011379 [Micractinium sp. CCAP 211/92]
MMWRQHRPSALRSIQPPPELKPAAKVMTPLSVGCIAADVRSPAARTTPDAACCRQPAPGLRRPTAVRGPQPNPPASPEFTPDDLFPRTTDRLYYSAPAFSACCRRCGALAKRIASAASAAAGGATSVSTRATQLL